MYSWQSVYSVPGHMADTSDFICNTYMHGKYMAYMCNVAGIFMKTYDNNLRSMCCSWFLFGTAITSIPNFLLL